MPAYPISLQCHDRIPPLPWKDSPNRQMNTFLHSPCVLPDHNTEDTPMPYRICYIAEVILSASTAIIALAVRLLLSSADTPQKGEMSWLLLPLIGSILASVGAFLFNPSLEDRKTVSGRMMVGVFIGTVAPNIIFYCSETIQKASVIPSVPLLLGFGICTLVYILSKPFSFRASADPTTSAGKYGRRPRKGQVFTQRGRDGTAELTLLTNSQGGVSIAAYENCFPPHCDHRALALAPSPPPKRSRLTRRAKFSARSRSLVRVRQARFARPSLTRPMPFGEGRTMSTRTFIAIVAICSFVGMVYSFSFCWTKEGLSEVSFSASSTDSVSSEGAFA